MLLRVTLLALAALAILPAPGFTAPMHTQPPQAERRPHSETHHGVRIEDPYFWLKDQGYPKITDPDVLGYLTAENTYFEAWEAKHHAAIETLFQEMKARIKEDDASVPAKDGDWLYWWKFEPGAQYRRWWRKPVTGGADELILDEPKLAEGHDYFRLGGAAVSPDGKLIAYAVDDNGSERFKLRVREIASGRELPEVSAETIGAPVWAADSKALAYMVVSAEWRPYRAMLHRLDGPAPDRLLYEEKDPSFFVGIGRTHDRRWMAIHSADHVTSEVRLVPTIDLGAEPLLVSPRKTGREYEVDGDGERLVIRTNDAHVNFRVVTADPANPGEWHELIAGSDEVYIRDATPFRGRLVLEERVGGLDQVRVIEQGHEHRVAFPEASYVAALESNPEYDTPTLRLSYQSMVTPPTVFDYDPSGRKLTTLKVQEIPSGYDPSRYETRRLTVTARDGAKVPVSIVMKRGEPVTMLHLYGYGAYGYAVPPGFSTSRLSLVDRGVAFAIAHIRGGDDLGYHWYLDGKLTKRANTYNDFVDAARGLIAAGYASEGQVSASGGSAGGNLMGVVLNTDPQLWRAVAAHVPFVDMLNTMLDASLPLTPIEWPEWGDPIRDKAAFERIRALSPYDNVTKQAYPPILVTAGLNDPRVTYWEPAKWVAKLRATKTDRNLLLLKTNMGAGHGGKSGRYESLRETAEEYAFVLEAFGVGVE